MNKATHISLLSFNTLGTPFFAPLIKPRYEKIAGLITDHNIDIVCFQEITTFYHLYLLKKYMKHYPYIAYKKLFYGPKGGMVIFSKLPLEQISYQRFSALGKFNNISFYTELLRNGVLISKIKDLPFYIMNTHLITDFEFKWSKTNRLYTMVKSQVNDSARIFNTIAKDNATVLLTGDFNMAKDTPLYHSFINKTQAVDLFKKDTIPTYYHNRVIKHFQAQRNDRIDYIFLKQGAIKIDMLSTSHMFDKQVLLSNGKLSFLSDHIALLTKFSY